jgi:hypothetical protein
MKKHLLVPAILLGFVSTACADIVTESDRALTTVARWGLCLQEKMDDTTAKAQVFSVVKQIDDRFSAKYGSTATSVAQLRWGDKYVEHYYGDAKRIHDKLPGSTGAICTLLGQQVIQLTR